MNPGDAIEFKAVSVEELRDVVESRKPPLRVMHPDGRVFEELNAATGTFRVSDMAGRLLTYTHAERIDYLPTLEEQHRASAATVPRGVPVLRVVGP